MTDRDRKNGITVVKKTKTFLVVFASIVCWQGSLTAVAQSTDALAAQAGIALKPIPHFAGTKPLYLPTGIPRPDGMVSPSGAIYVQQLQEENDYWLREVSSTPTLRDREWKPDFSSLTSYRASLQEHRGHLQQLLGLIEVGPNTLRAQEAALTTTETQIESLTLTLQKGFQARALLFVPAGKVSGAVIAIPGAATSSKESYETAEGQKSAHWLTMLLERRVAVCVLITVDRKMWKQSITSRTPPSLLPIIDRRELLSRLGFIVDRPLVGLEVQQVLALRDYLMKRFGTRKERIGLLGMRQGGMTALYAAAVDGHFGAVSIVDYFQQRETCWKEPVDRMLYGQLKEFGDAEIAGLIAPAPLDVISTVDSQIPTESVELEARRAVRFYQGLNKASSFRIVGEESAEAGWDRGAQEIAELLGARPMSARPLILLLPDHAIYTKNQDTEFEDLHAYLARVDEESDTVRDKYWTILKTPVDGLNAKTTRMRQALRQLMGDIPTDKMPLDPHTRLILLTDKFAAYDVLLDVLPGVHAYGQLLVPRQYKGRLPVVICQHGLGGRPTDITGIGEDPTPIYHALGAHLAELGYVVFAPYLTVPVRQFDLVNPLVRKAAAVGMMRTSLELAKLHRIIDYLQTLPFVDGERIGYYGLSYGGYSAIWMSPLESRIKASVVSGNFNDWRANLTNEVGQPGYLLHPDDDFFSWNILNRFTHVELIAAMYPRPVCVEFGQDDRTTTPEWHARAWQQVEAWKAAARLGGLTEKVVESHYEGVHEIHGIGSIAFLNRWLKPDLPDGRDHSYNFNLINTEFHGTSDRTSLATELSSELPLAEHNLDSLTSSAIRGRFYVSHRFPVLAGLLLKVSRIGNPGDLIFRFGTTPNGAQLGEARIHAHKIDQAFDLWYEAELHPIRLDPAKLYYFEITASSGQAPHDTYIVYGPKPLGGTDEPGHFGLSYQIISSDQAYLRSHPQK